MSLDVYLTMPNVKRQPASEHIYIRENGATKEISREEWGKRFPNREPVVFKDWGNDEQISTVYSQNITHNLNGMASEAGIYKHLWRPEEMGVTKAAQLIEPLRDGLALLQSDPVRFKSFNPENGWGTYDGLMEFVADYLAACEAYPDADVSVSR